MKKLSGKVAVITGAGSGIGRSLAVELAQRRCRLALADNHAERLNETRQQIERLGAVCSTHLLDVAEREAVESLAAEVADRHGGVQLLFNNAGVTLVDRIETLSYDDFKWLMDINFWGVVYGTKAFLPYLREADEAHIINVSSLLGLLSCPLQAAYNASKFAVRGFTEALRMELAGTRIGVSCVHPGGIKTGIVRNSRIGVHCQEVSRDALTTQFDKAARTTAERAAARIIRGIENGRRRIVIGLDARIADWVVRLFPGSYERVLRLHSIPAKAQAESEA